MRKNTMVNLTQIENTDPLGLSFISNTSSFIKLQINEIISSELKEHNLRIKIQKQLQIYNKEQVQQKIKKSYYEQKVKNIPVREKTIRKKKYEDFIKLQKERREKLKYFLIEKKGNHQNKFDSINRSIDAVKDKAQNLFSDDVKLRLTRIPPETPHRSRKSLHKSTQYSRAVSTSHNNSRCHIVKEYEQQKQTHLVTNYLKKIMKSESNLLQKDLVQHSKKKLNNFDNKVTCFIDFRKKKQEELMNRVEKEYNERMQSFNQARSLLLEQNDEKLMKKTFQSKKSQDSILNRKQQIHTHTIDNLMRNFRIRQQKENLILCKKRQFQYHNNQKLYYKNIQQLKEERHKGLLDHKLKFLATKFQNIKRIGVNEKIDEKTFKIISEMIDKNDPQYNNLIQFLKVQRKVFMDNMIKKEEERNKLQKGKKSNKINTN